IRRIWNAQVKSLSSKRAIDSKNEEELGEEDDVDDEKAVKDKEETGEQLNSLQSKPDDDLMSVADSQAHKKTKKLMINRLVRTKTGEQVWKSEILSDPRVINAYLRQRYMIESQAKAAKEAASVEQNEEETSKRRSRKKLQDQVITENISAIPKKLEPTPSASQATAAGTSQPLKLKFSLSSIADAKPKYPSSPEGELSRLLETIASDLISMPSSREFYFPVSKTEFPNYHTVVRTPICLEEIKT
ncbi:hypothetical protein HK100_009854, partial [Physocladia obscura]